jgi:hypothetical protein
MKSLVLLGLLAACGGNAESEPDLLATVPYVLHDEPRFGLALTPHPALADATQRAAERWSSATGCDVRVAPGGVPVVHVRGLTTTSGKRAAGALRHTGNDVCKRIDIDDELGGPRTVAHEIGHCLGAHGHAESGLMAEGAGSGVIEAASLTFVCSKVACTAFQPEGE